MKPTPPAGIDPEHSIWLPNNVPSSKNNRELGYYFLKPEDNSSWYIMKDGQLKNIRPTLQSSKRTKEYVKSVAYHIIENRQKFLQLVKDWPKPYIVELLFVRDSKRIFDFSNAQQVIADCMSGHYWKDDTKIPYKATQWIEDDNCNEVLFIPPLLPPHYLVDTKQPGVWITPHTDPTRKIIHFENNS